ncbi:MAG: EF-hand domain-containing protein [Planctomycetota bacterium]|jgi:Ca2+-binding EF-hand superfamily protein
MKSTIVTGLLVLALAAAPSFADERDESEGVGKALLKAFDTFDSDGDGKLTGDDFPLGKNLFNEIDSNGDGTLTRREIRAFSASSLKGPEGKGKRKKDKKAGKKDEGDAMDAEAPSRMTVAQARKIMERDPRFDPESRRAQLLRNFDRDPKDGVISRKEYASGDGDSIFRRFDRNRNGELDERELIPLMKRQINELAKTRKAPARNYFVENFDLNRDRRVTKDEYAILRGPASYFAKYDVDANGIVTFDETRYPERYRPSKGTASKSKSPLPPNRTVWDLYDKDGDRRVTEKEWGGAENVFRRLDKNGDGVLSSADA